MPQMAANLSMLFTELPFMQRFEAAAKAGFTQVEYLFPYEYEAEQLRAELDKYHLTQVLHNLPPGDWAAGERGIACLPDRVDEFAHSLEQGIAYATALGVHQLNCLAGIQPAGVSDEQAMAVLVGNVRLAGETLKAHGIRLLLEPINHFDMPGFFVNTTAKGLAVLDEAGSDNAYLQYDIYHAQRMEGELANTMAKHLPRIAHMQLADNPGRGEPGTGEINYAFLFAHLDAIGYTGSIGCEYKPKAGTEAGLAWLQRYDVQL
jgi:hydroxypyruvate isomerase